MSALKFCSVILWAFLASTSAAAPIFYEGFVYPPGQSLVSQPVWQSVGPPSNAYIAAGNFAPANLQSPVGNSLALNGDASEIRRAFPSQSSGAWFSMALRVNPAATVPVAGASIASFADSSGAKGAVVWIRYRNANRFDIGGSVTPGQPIMWNTNSDMGYNVSAPYYIIGQYIVSTKTTNIFIFRNGPETSLFGGPQNFGSAIQVTGGTALSNIS